MTRDERVMAVLPAVAAELLRRSTEDPRGWMPEDRTKFASEAVELADVLAEVAETKARVEGQEVVSAGVRGRDRNASDKKA